ncbi:hypothetical protein WME99_51520 [Sorangium sp. So ce136]|uniref:hypothetical protein n=1 Tax=Sorangium sp. So ce136 TaxID=3133284 RepID=UPI003F06E2BA
MTELIVGAALLGLFVVGGLVVWLRFTVGVDMRRAKVLSQGEPGTARILRWDPTAVSHGGNSILRFTLDIRPRAGGPELQGTADYCVRPMEAPQFQAGMERPVRFLREGERLLVEFE